VGVNTLSEIETEMLSASHLAYSGMLGGNRPCSNLDHRISRMTMMNSFAEAIKMANRLPAKDREALGILLIQEMQSDERWAKLFAGSQTTLSSLAEGALAEHRLGLTKR